MSTHTTHATGPRPLHQAAAWANESLYILDVMILALGTFLVVIGAIDPFSEPLTVVALFVIAAIWAEHRRWAKRHRTEWTHVEKMRRERRGF